ncbi:MAG: 30S ribosomal protein S20 [Saprospiraceae bacterium]
MAHHQSAKKRIRQDAVKRLRNRYYKKSARSAIAKFRSLEDEDEAKKSLPMLSSMIDRLAKRGIWHQNKAANLKSSLAKYTAGLGQQEA